MAKADPHHRSSYPRGQLIPTRWADNDAYGHVNNVVYYSYFDTVVNQHLVEAGCLDIHGGEVIGLVVETRCQYFAPLSFPERAFAGLRVARMGSSSVHYEIAMFRDEEELACAQGHFVHVYVDRATRRPVPLPPRLREALSRLLVTAPAA